AAEVDDVQDVEVLAKLVVADVELVHDRGHRKSGVLARRADQETGESDEARESLRANHGLRAAVARPGSAVRLRDRAGDGFRHPELAPVTLAQERQALGGIAGQV